MRILKKSNESNLSSFYFNFSKITRWAFLEKIKNTLWYWFVKMTMVSLTRYFLNLKQTLNIVVNMLEIIIFHQLDAPFGPYCLQYLSKYLCLSGSEQAKQTVGISWMIATYYLLCEQSKLKCSYGFKDLMDSQSNKRRLYNVKIILVCLSSSSNIKDFAL